MVQGPFRTQTIYIREDSRGYYWVTIASGVDLSIQKPTFCISGLLASGPLTYHDTLKPSWHTVAPKQFWSVTSASRADYSRGYLHTFGVQEFKSSIVDAVRGKRK